MPCMVLGAETIAKNEAVKTPRFLELILEWRNGFQLTSSGSIQSHMHSVTLQNMAEPGMVEDIVSEGKSIVLPSIKSAVQKGKQKNKDEKSAGVMRAQKGAIEERFPEEVMLDLSLKGQVGFTVGPGTAT